MAKFKVGDRVASVKTGANGEVQEAYGDEWYAVQFDGAKAPDRVKGYQIRIANSARNAKFKVGDKVKFFPFGRLSPKPEEGTIKSIRGGKVEVVRDGDKAGWTIQIDELQPSDNAARNTKFKVGDKVMVKGIGKMTIKTVDEIHSIRGPVTKYGVQIGGGRILVVPEWEVSKNSSAANAKFKVGDRVKHSKYKTKGTVFEIAADGDIGVEWDNGGQAYYGRFHYPISIIQPSKNACALRSTNAAVQAALNNAARNASDWEKVYQIGGLPVKFVYRGDPYNDLKATVEGGNRDYVSVGRIISGSPISQSEAEKMAKAKWSQIKRTAR